MRQRRSERPQSIIRASRPDRSHHTPPCKSCMQSDKHDNLMPVRQRAARSWVAQPSAGVPTGRTPIANALRARSQRVSRTGTPPRWRSRRPGRLFIDYLRHSRSAPIHGAREPDAAPVTWTKSRGIRSAGERSTGSTDCLWAEGGRSSCAARLASMRFHNEIRVVSGLSAETVIGHDERRARRQQFGDALDRIRRHLDAAEGRLGLVWR